VRELMDYARQQGGVDVISGIEFYGTFGEENNLHLTALDYDMDNPALRAFVKERVELRSEFTRKCIRYGIEKGIFQGFTLEDVERFCGENTWLCHDHVRNLCRHYHIPIPENLMRDVFKAPEMLEFKPKKPSAEKVIRIVREAGGVIALAHPNGKTHLIKDLVKMGLNGVEISHPEHRGNTSELAIEAAKAFHLYRCGGTDHTGPMSGCDNGTVFVTNGISEEDYFILKERRLG
jgi:predicted metal-dependent phosphoesterase TrpH